MKTRQLKRCKECGMLNRRKSRNPEECLWCNSTNYNIIEFPDFSAEEETLIKNAKNKLLYIINFSFNEIRPSEDDYFGCIDLCNYLKKKYELGDEVYELLGMVQLLMISIEHSKLIPEYGEASGRITHLTLEDGRRAEYSLVYYSPVIEHEISEYEMLSDNENKLLKENTKEELEKLICIVSKLKPCSTGRMLLDYPIADFDFNLETMNKVRTHAINYVKPKRDQKAANKKRNRIVEQITQSYENTDPNYVKTATCPTCGKKSVYKIGAVKRTASIGFFGLFSKDIAKTMECRSCGYKW